jgi:hypothetical protein
MNQNGQTDQKGPTIGPILLSLLKIGDKKKQISQPSLNDKKEKITP